MKTFKESIIDIPRNTYAKGVFDKADTKDPIIKPSVIALINKQLEMFEEEYPVVKVGLILGLLVSASSNTALAYVLLGISMILSLIK